MNIDELHNKLAENHWLIEDLTEVDYLLIADVKEIIEQQFSLNGVNYSLPTKEELSALIKELIDIDTHRKMTDNYLSAEKAGKLLCAAMKTIAKNNKG